MLQTYLINILVFCGIILLLALTVGVIQLIIILVDVRRVSKEVTDKVRAVTSVIDIFSLVLGGLGAAKKKINRSTLVAFTAGLKKALEVLFKK